MDLIKVVLDTHTIVEEYGHYCLPSHPQARWVEKESTLFLMLGERVISTDFYVDMAIGREGYIPVRYVVRAGADNTFVCGLDLTTYGRVWCGYDRLIYDTVEDAIASIPLADKNIFLEGYERF